MKSSLETHSISTLAARFRGLVCRNTLKSWLDRGRMLPVMLGKNGHYLFRTDYLDEVAKILERCHERRVAYFYRNKEQAAKIRENARRNAEAILAHNERCEFSKRPDLRKRERSPAVNDLDAVNLPDAAREKPTSLQTSGLFGSSSRKGSK